MSHKHQPIEGLSCPTSGFSLSYNDPMVPGISLIYMADKAAAGVGELLTFTAWILNSTGESLHDVNFRMRSLTNPGLEHLQYRSQPSKAMIRNRILLPRRSVSCMLAYQITAADVQQPGVLISAIQASVVSPSKGRLYSECDALIDMRATPA